MSLKNRQVFIGYQHSNSLSLSLPALQFAQHSRSHMLDRAIVKQERNRWCIVQEHLAWGKQWLMLLLPAFFMNSSWARWSHIRQHCSQRLQAYPSWTQNSWHIGMQV